MYGLKKYSSIYPFFPQGFPWKNVFHQNKEKEEADLDPEISEPTQEGGENTQKAGERKFQGSYEGGPKRSHSSLEKGWGLLQARCSGENSELINNL